MDSFEYEASGLADQSTFDEQTWTVTTPFANNDDFLDRVEAELGFDDDDDPSLADGSLGELPRPRTAIKISADARASLASTLNDPDMDLAANSHASKKSRRTNFSSSTGNSTNRSVNTRQFSASHKSRALQLATEKKRMAQLEHDNKEMSRRLKELEALLPGTSATTPVSTSIISTTEIHRSNRISGVEVSTPTIELSNESSSDSNPSDDDLNKILPTASGKAHNTPRPSKKVSISTSTSLRPSANRTTTRIAGAKVANIPVKTTGDTMSKRSRRSNPCDPSKIHLPYTNGKGGDGALDGDN